MTSFDFSSMIPLNVGREEFCTTVGTLTLGEPDSMLAVMFSDRYAYAEKGYIFIDRDGKHFRHILNWSRRGTLVPTLQDSDYFELLNEAEYYQLLYLVNELTSLLETKREESEIDFSNACVNNASFSGAKFCDAKFYNAEGDIIDSETRHRCEFNGANRSRTFSWSVARVDDAFDRTYLKVVEICQSFRRQS